MTQTICVRCGKTLYDGIHTCTPKADSCVSQTTEPETVTRFFGPGLRELSADEIEPDYSNVFSVMRTQVMSKTDYLKFFKVLNAKA